MSHRSRLVLGVCLVALMAAAAVNAGADLNGRRGLTARAQGPVSPSSSWQSFYWGGPTLPVAIDENPLTFELAGGGLLKITDAFICGDIFQVWDNGVLIGSTSTPDCDGLSETDDPDIAFNGGRYSSGSFELGPGAHSIELFLTNGYYNEGSQQYSGGAFFQLLEYRVPALSPVGVAALILVLLAGALLVLRRVS